MSDQVVIFFGSSSFAVPALRALDGAGLNIAYVVTRPDRIRARGGKTLPTPVKAYAVDAGLKVLEPESIKDNKDFMDSMKKAAPGLLVVVSYGKILPVEMLELATNGAVNIHASILPEYRGAAPIQRAIMDGQETTGVSLMQMGEGLDDGDVIAEVSLPIEDLDAGTLTELLAEAGADLLMENLQDLFDGTATGVPQDEKRSTYANKIEKTDAHIDFSKTATEIERLVRAMSPTPGAYAKRGEERIGISKVQAVPGSAAPGHVVSVSGEGISVGTGEGLLVIKELKMPGKRTLPVADYLRGNNFAEDPPLE